MKTSLAHYLSLLALMLIPLSTLRSNPIDLSEGYGPFQWGISPDILLPAAQKAYGSENVTIEQNRVKGLSEKKIIAKTENVKNTFYFIRDSFYAVERESSPSLSGYYTNQDIDLKEIAKQAISLYSAPDTVKVDSLAEVTGSTNDRVMGIRVTLSIINKELFDQEIDHLRSKSPDIYRTLLEPLKKP